MKKIAINKKARFDYEILEKFEAGLVLKGYEAKSIKTGHISLKGAFVAAQGNELFLINASIPLASFSANVKDYDPTASRKLLLNKKEITYLTGKKQQEGLTIVPLSVYNKKGRIKLEIALARGKKKQDKRQTIKKRETERDMRRLMKEKVVK